MLMKPFKNLTKLALNSKNSRGRLIKEDLSQSRSEFQRDRDRILHSAAFRRLKHKTQVFVSHEGDHYRTRLTHSLEVSQIARSICRIFGLNEDMAETLSLAHDIGHPPFGHAGEHELSKMMRENQGFDHNDQAIRIVHHLEKKYFDFDGLNLTWETLEGLVKHNGPLINEIPNTINELDKKFNLSLSEYSSLEAQVAAISDDIAYNNHDIDDGLRAGFFSYNELMELPLIGEVIKTLPKKFEERDIQRINNEITRRSTNLMINDILDTIQNNIEIFKINELESVRNLNKPVVHFSNEMQSKVDSVRLFLSNKMYNHVSVNKMTDNAKKIISFLYVFLLDADDSVYDDLKINLNQKEDKSRIICDFISGMTDNFAQSIYEKYS